MKKANIHIFGTKIGEDSKSDLQAKISEKVYQYEYNHKGGSPSFGLIVFFSGIVLLLNSLGLISWEFWNYIWMFWPVILILIGIQIILGHNWLSKFLIFLFTLGICSFVILYILIQINSPLIDGLPRDFIEYFDFINSIKK